MNKYVELLQVEGSPSGRYRATFRDDDGHAIDIYEGPFRFIVDAIVRKLEPDCGYKMYKLRKRK